MSDYGPISDEIVEQFILILEEEWVERDPELLARYSHDETEDLRFLPELALSPRTPEQISEILALCNKHRIPVTPRGAGTGLSGGAIPVRGGVVISTWRMNDILEIDPRNMMVITEPGVITQELQEEVQKLNLYYPPDPASKGSCFIGGNVAENSGGPRAVKYGVVKDWVLNLEVVLPNGDIIWTGANTLKNSTGYNLTQLFVGSEGTLGIITKVVLRLIPYPPHRITLLAPFRRMRKAMEAVSALFMKGLNPSALEFMERDAIVLAMEFAGRGGLSMDEKTEAQLLIEVDGFNMDLLYEDCEKISEILSDFDVGEILIADNEKDKEALWYLRSRIAEAVKAHSVYKEEDTVVPRAFLPELIDKVKEIGNKYGFRSICYGHAGDGNLHVNILKGNLSEDFWNDGLREALRELFTEVRKLGGTISGEHGIGLVQKEFLPIVFSPAEIAAMKNIKKIFDPGNILNPGKIFPEESSLKTNPE